MGIKQTYEFLEIVLNSLTEHIAVIDRKGKIQFTNKAWVMFARINKCKTISEWQDVDYLKVCDEAAARGDKLARQASDGIRQVIDGLDHYFVEYPCHSPREKRWFTMRVTPFRYDGSPYVVISHQNITERKLAEEEVLKLSRLDGLTGMANRRYFNQFFNEEWRRCARLRLPISMAMIDIDNFKFLNDTYGHASGDDCLVKVGNVMKKIANRPGDLCARYGGEEFVLIFGNSKTEQLWPIINNLLNNIRELRIPNEKSPANPTVTVSVGLATMYPDLETDPEELLRLADRLLYSAKTKGGNQVVIE